MAVDSLSENSFTLRFVYFNLAWSSSDDRNVLYKINLANDSDIAINDASNTGITKRKAHFGRNKANGLNYLHLPYYDFNAV